MLRNLARVTKTAYEAWMIVELGTGKVLRTKESIRVEPPAE
jgi:D-alanyl-D-alanine carboxypeptidase